MRTRILPIAALALLPTLALADKVVMKFQFAGSPCGENVFEQKPDGSFTSETHIEMMGNKIDSSLKGTFKNKKLLSFELTQGAAGAQATMSYADGKYTVAQGTQKMSNKLTFKTTSYFANFHPQISRTTADVLTSAQPGMQPVETLVLDSLVVTKLSSGLKSGRQAKHNGKAEQVKTLVIDLGNVKVEYPLDADNNVIGMDVPLQKFQGSVGGWTDLYIDPVAKYTELSQPTHNTKKLDAVKMPMRDGVELVADIVLPSEDGKYPVILTRTPYGRGPSMLDALWWAKRGYVFIAQDVRGRNDSGGVWDPFMNERTDGYDTIDWISKQPWCDGKVGMIGGSYLGMVQWAAAVERHPALKCIVPQVSPPDAFFNIPYDHGVFMLWGNLWWSNLIKDKVAHMELASQPLPNLKALETLPLTKIDDKILGRNIPWFDAWLKKDRPSQFKGFDFGKDMSKVTIPALHISGWWDGDGIGTKMNWATMAKAGRTNQWLIYGPWPHAFNSTSKFGDVNYGSTAILELDSLYLRWFDTWLKGRSVSLDRHPKVRVFLTGANEWRYLSGWPDKASKQMQMYLSSGKDNRNGLLLPVPSKKAGRSGYTYDPAKLKVPAAMAKASDPDAASTKLDLEKKDNELLIFRSAPMKAPLDFAGPIEVDLYFSTSAKDTDFFATVLDIDPNGTMRIIGMPGKMRAKYLSGWNTPSLLTPGKTYKMTIAPWDTAHRFKKGHRLAILITSQLFPMYARNLNTGESYATGTKMVTAKQTIYSDPKRPSAIRFYVLPPK